MNTYKEEINAVTVETKTGDIRVAIIRKVLKCADARVAEIVAQRCIHVTNDDRKELLNSEACEEILNDHTKKEVQEELQSMHKEEEQIAELQKTVKTLRATPAAPAASKKLKFAIREWPVEHDISMPKYLACIPPYAKGWYDSARKR